MTTTRVLLTGAAGFVGHHVLEHYLLNTDWHTVCLVKMDRAGDLNRIEEMKYRFPDFNKRVTIVRHDLMDKMDSIHKHIGKVDYILHLAANSHVDYSISHPIEVFENNAITTAKVFEYARTMQPDIKKILYFSTDEVYGPAPEGYDFTEDDKLHPSNPYSAGKAAGEMIAMAYGKTYGIPYLITNTMNIFGERQDPEKLIPKCMQYIKDGKKMTIHGTPGNVGKRHWLHARNAADATLFLLANDIVNDKVHIVGDVEKDNLWMFKFVAEIMGKPDAPFEYLDFHSTRPGHDSRYAMSGKKLSDLGWVPPVEFEDSFRKTVKWTMEHSNWIAS